MWTDTFKTVGRDGQNLIASLLRDRIPVAANGTRMSVPLLERASGALASRLPVRLQAGEMRRLTFLLPNPTQSMGRFVAVSLLLADFVHRNAPTVPAAERGPLIGGDLLLVTQYIRECVTPLKDLSIKAGTEALPLTRFWPIEVLSQYAAPTNGQPRIFVANPGWLCSSSENRRFGTVIVDGSHPRTMERLDEILRQPSVAAAPVQVLVIPPCEQDRIRRLQDRNRISCLTWAWDPAAVNALEGALGNSTRRPATEAHQRTQWVCNDAVGDTLAEVHQLLVGSMRAGNGASVAPLLQAWSVYHRLRQLCVPLVQLEEARKQAYRTMTLTERIKTLEEQEPEASGALGTYTASRWPQIINGLRSAYTRLLEQKEPPKFYALAEAMLELLESDRVNPDNPLRIVAPTAHEGSLLANLLSDLVDGWSKALQSGAISIATVRDEPRQISQGQCCATFLQGFRTSDTRYLDVYPGVPVHLVVYPYEAEIDDMIQRRVHASIEELQEDGPRLTVLQTLRLPVTSRPSDAVRSGSDAVPRSRRAETERRTRTQEKEPAKRKFLVEDDVEPVDIPKLAGLAWSDDVIADEQTTASGQPNARSGRAIRLVEVIDSDGEKLCFPANRLIDVYHPATELKERVRACELRSGMLMIVLVDDPYEDLFTRLLEAIRDNRDLKASLALDVWQLAKRAALSKFGNSRRMLHNTLSEKGVSVEYAATVGWYSEGEDEIIAPLDEADFKILAGVSGIYSDDAAIAGTFRCIQSERNLRRQCGKVLYKLLSQLAAGKHYEAALKSANALGTEVEHVAAAVSLREVAEVRDLSM